MAGKKIKIAPELVEDLRNLALGMWKDEYDRTVELQKEYPVDSDSKTYKKDMTFHTNMMRARFMYLKELARATAGEVEEQGSNTAEAKKSSADITKMVKQKLSNESRKLTLEEKKQQEKNDE